jgi:hypothetical protein
MTLDDRSNHKWLCVEALIHKLGDLSQGLSCHWFFYVSSQERGTINQQKPSAGEMERTVWRTLEGWLRIGATNTSRPVGHWESQLLAYANDIDIVGRSQSFVRYAYLALEREAAKVGLKINEQKKKYMIAARNDRTIRDVGQLATNILKTSKNLSN